MRPDEHPLLVRPDSRHLDMLRPGYGAAPAREPDRWPGFDRAAYPPRREAAREPDCWARLKAARDPVPELFEGTTGMASWHRGLGQYVERELRASPFDGWWFDPELPLGMVLGGWPDWEGGTRADTGESLREFRKVTARYVTALQGGGVFPPVVVSCTEPWRDLAAIGSAAYRAAGQLGGTILTGAYFAGPHYSMINGRHRATAAWETGLRTFPAYVLGPLREVVAATRAHGLDWLVKVQQAAREYGRRGVAPEALTGPQPAAELTEGTRPAVQTSTAARLHGVQVAGRGAGPRGAPTSCGRVLSQARSASSTTAAPLVPSCLPRSLAASHSAGSIRMQTLAVMAGALLLSSRCL
jgi:hypothetical protein